jgi:hypothetical protein
MTGFDAIKAVVNAWDSTYTGTITIGYNMSDDDFENADGRETEQVFISDQSTTPIDPFENGAFDAAEETYTLI